MKAERLEEIQTVKTTLPYEPLTAKIDFYSALNKRNRVADLKSLHSNSRLIISLLFIPVMASC